MAQDDDKLITELQNKEYEAGFVSEYEMDIFPKGLNEDIVRRISAAKNEPEFMLEFRLKAYRAWLEMKLPQWAHLKFTEPDYQDISFYAAPKKLSKLNSLRAWRLMWLWTAFLFIQPLRKL